MSICLGTVALADPVILAPMSGVTDLPFRRLVKRLGAGLVVSEMIASEAMIRETRQSLTMARSCRDEQPMAVQLAGCEPQVMAEAAKLNADRGARIIDINFGCPVKKVVKNNGGSGCLKDLDLVGRQYIEAVYSELRRWLVVQDPAAGEDALLSLDEQRLGLGQREAGVGGEVLCNVW